MDNVFRFARFEADRERYQLRCGTRAIKLERIPLDLLFLLLEYCGKLVSREQIVARLWRDGSFLDTERSINTAIRKIRKALGDDPRHPQFVETVVGKGYRFIAPLASQAGTQDSRAEVQQHTTPARNQADADDHEIRLRSFAVETAGGTPVLTCDVMVGTDLLGRLPLSELELPRDVSLPLNPKDKLLLKLYGVRVNLTAEAARALHAFSISVLQSGLRARETDVPLSAEDLLTEPRAIDC